MREAGLRGGIFEFHVSEIVIQVAGSVASFERSSTNEKDIHEPVIVIIEDRHSRASCLDDVLLLRSVTRYMNGGEAGLLSNVAEIDGHVGNAVADRFERSRKAAGRCHPLKGARSFRTEYNAGHKDQEPC